MLAHHPYDSVVGFGIAFLGILLIVWAERRAKRRREPEDRPDE